MSLIRRGMWWVQFGPVRDLPNVAFVVGLHDLESIGKRDMFVVEPT